MTKGDEPSARGIGVFRANYLSLFADDVFTAKQLNRGLREACEAGLCCAIAGVAVAMEKATRKAA